MSWIIGLILKIGGSGIINAVLEPIFNFIVKNKNIDLAKFQTKVGIERDVLLGAMQAEIMGNAQRLQYYQGMRATQYLICLALIPAIIHQSAIFLDSTFCNDQLKVCTQIGLWLGMPWRVPKAPAPYDEREWLMIASLLGIQTGLAAGMGILRAILNK